MTATALDPKTALIVIDLQKGTAALPTVHPVGDIARQAGRLAAAFRARELSVILVNVTGRSPGRTEQSFRSGALPPDWTELLPELGRAPDDLVISKQTWGAFTDTDLTLCLRATGITQVVLAGIATSIGVESTARQAHELGFNVTLAVDAMTDLSAEAHTNSITWIFPRLGETGTTQEIIALLDSTRA